MTSSRRPRSFRYRLRESCLILLGRLPARLTTVDALTAAQGELAQSRAELGKIAKAAAEARTMLVEVESDLSLLREENNRLRLENSAPESDLYAARAAGAPQA